MNELGYEHIEVRQHPNNIIYQKNTIRGQYKVLDTEIRYGMIVNETNLHQRPI